MVILRFKNILEIVALLILFFCFSFFVQHNLDFFKQFISYGVFGILVYFFIVIFAIVFAPISSVLFIPLMSGIFGWFITWMISWLAWIIGSLIVFFLCRIYGITLVSKFISLDKIRKFEQKFSSENIFLTVLGLRMIVPVDILSYALGLFSRISFKTYFLTTVFGTMLVTFILAYAGSVSLKIQILIFILVVFIVFIVFLIREILKEKRINSCSY